jgi:phage terminase large subunit GpA-like protein
MMLDRVTEIIDWYRWERPFITPASRISISEWSELKRVLSDASEERGPLRLIRTPYLVPILNCFQDSDVHTVVFMKPAQIAGTECFVTLLGYFSDQEPCPMMFVLADESTATYMARERIKKMYQNSPELHHHFSSGKFSKDEMILENGAYLAMAWSSSIAKLASRPMRILVLDEVDKPGYYLTTKEASPISLALERTITFNNPKVAILSTPTVETGNITKELETCDVVYDWHVACPYCGVHQPLRFSGEYTRGFKKGHFRSDSGQMMPIGRVVWEGGKDASDRQIADAGYECGICRNVWNTAEKNHAVENGRMVSRSGPVARPGKIGFHINRLYSLLGKSGDIPRIVRDFIGCLGDPKKLQGFVNSTLAEPWKIKIIKTSEEELLRTKVDIGPQQVPAEAVALTAGIDPQKVGFWYVVRAWAKDYTSWLVHYGFLLSWGDVEEFLFNTRYPVIGTDREMPIWRCAMDTGGGKFDDDPSMTEAAYWWIRANGQGRGCRVYATKGSARPLAGKIGLGKKLDKTPSGVPLPGSLQLILIDTTDMKDTVHYRIGNALEGDPQPAFLHRETGVDYARQILAEEKVVDEKGMQVWVQIRPDNHLLDCEVLAHSAADPEFMGGGVNIVARAIDDYMEEKKQMVARKAAQPTRAVKRVYRRPDWLDRR